MPRRQVRRPWRKPLVVLTPKSLLRHQQVVSPLADLATGAFRRILPDPGAAPAAVSRVLLCCGKLAWELLAERERRGRADVAILRLEQLAPLPKRRLAATLDEYPNAEQYFWVQEEPANQGAWPTLGLTLPEVLPEKLAGIKRISRRAMSAPSSGSSKVHAVEQQEIIDEAFG